MMCQMGCRDVLCPDSAGSMSLHPTRHHHRASSSCIGAGHRWPMAETHRPMDGYRLCPTRGAWASADHCPPCHTPRRYATRRLLARSRVSGPTPAMQCTNSPGRPPAGACKSAVDTRAAAGARRGTRRCGGWVHGSIGRIVRSRRPASPAAPPLPPPTHTAACNSIKAPQNTARIPKPLPGTRHASTASPLRTCATWRARCSERTPAPPREGSAAPAATAATAPGG